ARSEGPGRGAEIGFSLPLGKKPVAPPSDGPCPAVPAARKLRILIVEDNRDAARTLGALLTRGGPEVQVTHAGTAGVDPARRWGPDVVLSDLGLPEMDGYELALTLRRDPATAAARLIAVSGYGQEDDRRRSAEAGFDLHLVKPVDPVELQKLLAVLK